MDDKLKVEYEQCFENWRFLVGLRFTVLGFFLALTSGLLYGVFTAPILRERLYLVAFFGFVSSWAMIMLENRNRQLYHACISRAEAIESLIYSEQNDQEPVKADKALAHLILSAPPCKLWAWHAGGIYLVYGIALLIWFHLPIAVLLGILPVPPST